ncbi:hypothetical protein QZM26_17880 [Burkholderia multivorans]|uniref:hypothetical protein n=1 Tax=Burkholderia multivorans TaxID=87883 RepID=UPI000667F577|nr:hypothetical protein [Burkholderia multivorans]MDN7871280.1 hypothetical protein [Burkholderia multivorans]MDN7965488.1 hypothetical protein [Burkholderia multivorans]MDN7998061.1 hypothetical protein [Burkholderia multivorans]PRG51123.1 hypothetical protein C6T62_00130 [Burkholderia multivorans]
MFSISVRSNVRDIERGLNDLVRKQLPFATAQAINATAERVRIAQRENMKEVLDEPTPFTLNSVAIKKATKANPVAVVYVKPVAAAYLLPYEIGGKNKLNSKALLKPIGAKVNQYGNLPRNLVRRMAAKPNAFVGKVKTKNGVVDGVWLRTKKTRGKQAGLKLMVKFADAHDVRQRLNYRGVAKRVVSATFPAELDRAMAKALATAR